MAKKYYQQGFKNDNIMRQNAVFLIRKIDNLIKYLNSVYTLKITQRKQKSSRLHNGSKRMRLKLNEMLDSQKSPSASSIPSAKIYNSESIPVSGLSSSESREYLPEINTPIERRRAGWYLKLSKKTRRLSGLTTVRV